MKNELTPDPAFAAACFPLAGNYLSTMENQPPFLREARAGERDFPYTERHLQSVWYDPRWRPARLESHRGETIEVESPGTWNLEAGPDFLGAVLLVGPRRRRVTGDVEVHVSPSGWNQHGHRGDPRYQKVCLHLTYFAGHVPEDDLPAGTLQAALQPALKADPVFSFEQVDVTVYPYAGRSDPPPCRAVLSAWPVQMKEQLLEAAGQERLRQKAARLAVAVNARGLEQVLYEAMMAALGYQHNKPAFAELASRLPVERLRTLARGQTPRAFAILAGMSGLLPETVREGWDEETRNYVRGLWDVWWKERDALPEALDRRCWKLGGVRPLNHPLRRLAAAAGLFAGPADGNELLEGWMRGEPEALLERLQATLSGRGEGYWRRRVTLGGRPAPPGLALLGRDRWEAIALNVVVPLAAASGYPPEMVRACYNCLPPEGLNRITKQTLFYLFGADAPSALTRSAVRRQGLQQVFQDHCLSDRSRCCRCTFPLWLRQQGSPAGIRLTR